MNLSGVITHHADRNPERTALSEADTTVTYGELVDRTTRMAGALRETGVQRGDVVAVLLHNSLRFLDTMLACSHLGAIFMPLNWRLAGAELSYILQHADARLLISEPELMSSVQALDGKLDLTCVLIGSQADGRWASLDELYEESSAVNEAANVEGSDVHRLMYTSGTTARPKGVMITYDNLYWKSASHAVELGLTAADRGLACGPLYHVGALDMTTTNMLYVGGGTHLLRKFEPVAALNSIEDQQTTNLWLAPAMVNLLLAEPTLPARSLTSVRVVLDGGEKMPLPLIRRVLEAFPNAWFADAYGLTETVSGDTYLDKGKTIDKLGSVGRAVLHTEIQIVDADDRPLPAGQAGEICLRGPKVFKGYWRDPEATAKAKRGGWFHTGDLGLLDEDGFLFIVDRLKDMIISGGENISSLEVERVVYEHPAVLEAAVIASPHERWGEVPVAYVAVKEGSDVTEQELCEFCLQRLAKYKAPKGIRFVQQLPRNPSGKVLKVRLRELELEETNRTAFNV
jgi:acyl-CoA synthetase (AMP-forming)/AMP-acid ligase II